ncbi:MAG: heat-inducible transcription repressor HrcA [Actinobacteria bacterium]|nr:heat-inducible transcription repressor HrcA [Actinomycetota bacterium]
MLSERQRSILGAVVADYVSGGRPVGSRALASDHALEWSPSTIRAELASLEDLGFLTHPHTSAGRVPTDAGYRFYVEQLLASSQALPAPSQGELRLSQMRREIESAIRDTTEALSRVTDLVALVSAPPLNTATIHRIEVLRLQPLRVMVVVIASNGVVSKRVFSFAADVDPGLVEWASSYLNERLSGLAIGARMAVSRLGAPELSESERSFLAEISSAFTNIEDSAAEETLYVDGASHLLSEQRSEDLPDAEELMEALERRVNVLNTLRSALEERSVFVWIGNENPQPELRSVSVVGANYGLGYRNLGAVGVIGPLRMDYATAIASVREAASELSRFFEIVYDE